MPIELSPLPYDRTALEPHLSAEAVDRLRREQQAHVEAVNAMLDATLADAPLQRIVREARGALAARAAQAWGDEFHWNALRPALAVASEPDGALAHAITQSFGDVQKLRERFAEAARHLPGPGRLWLVQRRDGRLAVVATPDIATPLTSDDTPLLVCRMPEPADGAAASDARNRALAAFWSLLDWKVVASRMR